LISDILKKGVDNINLAEYAYLAQNEIDLTGGL
jgi:hypothetical protein